jgi:hypothetical protein
MGGWSDWLKEWVPLTTSAVGLISAVVGVLISARALVRMRREEKLREEEAAHRKLQSEALLEALFGVDRKISEQANQLRSWVEMRLLEQEKRFKESLSEVVARLAPNRQQGEQIREDALQPQAKALAELIRRKEQTLAGVRRAVADLDAGRDLDEIRKDLRAASVEVSLSPRAGAGNDLGQLAGLTASLFAPFLPPPAFALLGGDSRRQEREAFRKTLQEVETSLVAELASLRGQRG